MSLKDEPVCSMSCQQSPSPSYSTHSDPVVEGRKSSATPLAASPNPRQEPGRRPPPPARTSVRTSNTPTSAMGTPGAEEGKQPRYPRADRASAGGAFCCALRQRRLSAVHLNERAARRVHDAPQCGDAWSRAVRRGGVSHKDLQRLELCDG